ncbi:hypothetical protein CYY_007183 [Polysphondylium violaceum]|uniref:Uncharacterized protein n=1 Tax=Polysphondylium violaceum TaxID=133409 RepID=A0A8J4UXU7_9MYCE|nr:hypothetical protein CYY_007183 [Polysphondylium violaceum]
MGCNVSTESKASKTIEKDLALDRKQAEKEIKLLLLGAGDSGKSTIAKQMRLIHSKGFDDKEIGQFKEIMHSNVLSCIQLLIRNTSRYGVEVDASLKDKVEYYSEINPFELPLTPQIGVEIDTIWKDSAIQTAFLKSSEFNLPEVAGYCLKNIERIASENYVPTQEDILKCRQRTTGMKETEFTVDSINFKLLDVGGQKNERRKWIHYFEDVKTIIFCVALGDYDMNLVEDEEQNRMHDSLKLWTEIINNPFFKMTTFVLFLNKNDLFREKILKAPLSNVFPDYQGGFNYEKGLEFIRNKYFSAVPAGRTVVAHVTTATDTENINVVFDAVRRNIMNTMLKIHF